MKYTIFIDLLGKWSSSAATFFLSSYLYSWFKTSAWTVFTAIIEAMLALEKTLQTYVNLV
ncbi:hypothetical protein [Peribacillus simplex]|uniref:hypothetical protein n=1 Tax=Peribacillus simplex TaxID=1478 RepID=UPI000A47DC85|nr:hypothetical protein [Peribacillus simplex]